MDLSSLRASLSRTFAPLLERRIAVTAAGSLRVFRPASDADVRVSSPAPASMRLPATPAAGLPVSEPAGATASGPSWSDYLAQGFDPKVSIWGEAGRNAYMTGRANEVMRDLSREQVNQLMSNCRNEAERASLYNAFAGGPASGYAREFMMEHYFHGDMNQMNQFINFWNHINPACRPNFNPVNGEFVYPDDRWDLDSATYTRHLSEVWMGDGLGTKSRPLAGFAGVVSQGLAS